MEEKKMMKATMTVMGGALGLALLGTAEAQTPTGPPPAPQEGIGALKQSLQEDQARLRQYEWIETTAVSLKGEEKSRKQNRCYHGADGKVQKVLVAAPPPPEKKRGLRGRIIESKKEELSDYMERAVNLVKLYVPPDPGLIQRAKDAGKASIHILEPVRRARRGAPARPPPPTSSSTPARRRSASPSRTPGIGSSVLEGAVLRTSCRVDLFEEPSHVHEGHDSNPRSGRAGRCPPGGGTGPGTDDGRVLGPAGGFSHRRGRLPHRRRYEAQVQPRGTARRRDRLRERDGPPRERHHVLARRDLAGRPAPSAVAELHTVEPQERGHDAHAGHHLGRPGLHRGSHRAERGLGRHPHRLLPLRCLAQRPLRDRPRPRLRVSVAGRLEPGDRLGPGGRGGGERNDQPDRPDGLGHGGRRRVFRGMAGPPSGDARGPSLHHHQARDLGGVRHRRAAWALLVPLAEGGVRSTVQVLQVPLRALAALDGARGQHHLPGRPGLRLLPLLTSIVRLRRAADRYLSARRQLPPPRRKAVYSAPARRPPARRRSASI